MYEIKKIDVTSSAKMYASLIGIIYAIVAVIFLFVNIIVSSIQRQITFVGVASALLSLVLITILSIVFGAVTGVVFAWLYNLIAGKIGGVKISLNKVEVEKEKKVEDEE